MLCFLLKTQTHPCPPHLCWLVQSTTGLPLNHQLLGLGATFVRAAKTAPLYLMFSLGNRPAIVRQTAEVAFANQGAALAVEIWEVPIDKVG